MQIFKIILVALCIIYVGMSIYYYLKMRRLLNENSDVEVDKIMPKIQSIMKRISVVLYVTVAIFVIYLVVLII